MQTTSIVAELLGKEIGLTIEDIRIGKLSDQGYRRIQMYTEEGPIESHYYAAPFATKAIIFVGNDSVGFDSPGNNMYPRLALDLLSWQVNSLQIRFRDPMDVSQGVLDVLAGVVFLQTEKISSIGIVGHSFGGAVAIHAALAVPAVSTVVGLAPQNFGTEVISLLQDSQSVLLLHGKKDEVLPALSSATLYQLAHEPKDVFFYNNAKHNFNESAEKVYEKTKAWILAQL
jgi:pimeloyl-ACP methyl ester carboxylesterase